jgi:hypothetical protein
VFKSDFNLVFGVPHLDTCKFCDKLYMQLILANKEAERAAAISLQSELYHRKSVSPYNSLKTDPGSAKINLNLVVLCVDLQQALFCPTLSQSNVFYQRHIILLDITGIKQLQ